MSSESKSLVDIKKETMGLAGVTIAKSAVPIGPFQVKNQGSYYKEHFAKEIKISVDAMISDGEDKLFPYDDFSYMTPPSLQVRINQSVLYLVRELDTPDKKYSEWRKTIEVTRESEGICLRYKQKMKHSAVIAKSISRPVDPVKWKEELDDIIQNGEVNTRHKIKNLHLTEEQQELVRDSVVDLSNVSCLVTEKEIIIVKLGENIK